MTEQSLTDIVSPRRSRLRRRETLINALACIMGSLALVVMIATVFRVVTAKLWQSTQVNPSYMDSIYEDAKGRGWSGNSRENPALLAGEGDTNTREKTNSVKDVASDLKSSAAKSPEIEKTAAVPTVAASMPVEGANGIDKIETKRLEIEAVIRGFFESSTIDMKLAFSRDSMRVRPLMENYYSSNPITTPTWKNLGWVMTVDEPGYRFGYAQAVFEDAEPVSLVIEETVEGKYRVDWESSVSYGELNWKEFLKVRPAEPTLLRVIASKPQGTPEVDAPQGQEVLEIKHPAQEGSVLAYFDSKDPKFQPLLLQLKNGNWKDVPLTLRLCYPGTASTGGPSKGVRIANIEGKGWLILQGIGAKS